jgi:hypothetical protein
MEPIIFTAQFLGWLLIIESIGYLFRPHIMAERFKSREYTDLDGLTALFLGVGTMVVLTMHGGWALDWRIALAFVGISLVFRGVSVWVFPDYVHKRAVKLVNSYTNNKWRMKLIPELLFGLFLVYASLFLV